MGGGLLVRVLTALILLCGAAVSADSVDQQKQDVEYVEFLLDHDPGAAAGLIANLAAQNCPDANRLATRYISLVPHGENILSRFTFRTLPVAAAQGRQRAKVLMKTEAAEQSLAERAVQEPAKEMPADDIQQQKKRYQPGGGAFAARACERSRSYSLS